MEMFIIGLLVGMATVMVFELIRDESELRK